MHCARCGDQGRGEDIQTAVVVRKTGPYLIIIICNTAVYFVLLSVKLVGVVTKYRLDCCILMLEYVHFAREESVRTSTAVVE